MRDTRDAMNFVDIKAGDHVVLEYMGNAITPGNLRIEAVAKVTPTQIVLASNPRVGRQGRYRRSDGKPVGGGYLWPWITRLATPKQVAQSEAEKAAKAKADRENKQRQEAIEAKRRQLAQLFIKPFKPAVYSRNDGKFTVSFTLTAAQVIKLAALCQNGRLA